MFLLRPILWAIKRMRFVRRRGNLLDDKDASIRRQADSIRRQRTFYSASTLSRCASRCTPYIRQNHCSLAPILGQQNNGLL